MGYSRPAAIVGQTAQSATRSTTEYNTRIVICISKILKEYKKRCSHQPKVRIRKKTILKNTNTQNSDFLATNLIKDWVADCAVWPTVPGGRIQFEIVRKAFRTLHDVFFNKAWQTGTPETQLIWISL
uniref:Transposase n=1 Tax=Romanomermis culicivorax TaxID=13658 RepID=A0A915JUP6_ROMCU